MDPSLGLEPGVVRLVDYDERWPRLFAAEIQRLRDAGPGLPLSFEHIGSTAVPGLCAKPILDILAGRPAGMPPDDFIIRLSAAGYEHRGEQGIPGREFFRRGQPRSYHLHLVEEGNLLWLRYIAFRNCLRSNTVVAERYAALKRALATQFANDREAYIEGKTAFVHDILRGATVTGPR